VPGGRAVGAGVRGFFYVDFLESETKERERQADAIGRRGELLREQNQPDRAEKVERPGDRAADQYGGQNPLR